MELDYEQVFKCLASDVRLDPGSIRYCLNRIRNEGLTFLTRTLPELSKAVLYSIEIGYFERPTSFRWKGKALVCFNELLSGIFDIHTGYLLEAPDPYAIKRLRQVCEYFYKLSLPFDEKDLAESEQQFVAEDDSLALPIDCKWVDQLRKDVSTYYKTLTTTVVSDVYKQCPPRPGKGTYSGHKSDPGLWYMRKERPLKISSQDEPYAGFFKPYPSCPLKPLKVEDPDYSEVLFVPKDSRGPRVIVREPFSTLQIHMAFNAFMANFLEKETHNRVNFQSQQVNRSLVEVASIDRKWATIDLKSASDRVSYKIAERVFQDSPAVRYFIRRRTKQALLPQSKELLTLNKLAGMGSGLTFPTMSFLITLTITRSFVNTFGFSYDQARKLVYVYGDDIIIPTYAYDVAVKALERIFLKVNNSKSYRRSHFRESCGADFFNGVDVTPKRLRLSSADLLLNSGRLIVGNKDSFLYQLERHCRELEGFGLNVASFLRSYYYSVLEKSLGNLPDVSGCSPVLGRYSSKASSQYETDENGTCTKKRVYVPVSVRSKHYPSGYKFLGSYLRSSLNLKGLYDPDDNVGLSYDRVTIPRRVSLCLRKVASALLHIGEVTTPAVCYASTKRFVRAE